ncbi:unnamed protein product, partial [Staurois parvus]
MPLASAHQCYINATYHCLSVSPISASQCHLSMPISATYQCCQSVPHISAAYQCPSVMPVNAHQCHLPVPPHQCPSVPPISAHQCSLS